METGKTLQGDNTRDKILDAAEHEFAEKGFDGSRVDEIARIAGVNKAMLYYYFQSKELLLEALTKKNIDETEKIVEEVFEGIKEFDETFINIIMDRLISFVETKKDILRIITIEGLKTGTESFSIYKMLDPIYQKVVIKLKENGKIIADPTSFLIENFFISTLPLIFFFTLGEKWADFYKKDQKEVKDKFISIFKKLHYQYEELIK